MADLYHRNASTDTGTGAGTGAAKGTEPTKSKYRPRYACISCSKRKVKCDRVKPCHACCLRGLPSECEYDTTSEDRQYIMQADLIDNLKAEVQQLKQQLAERDAAAPLAIPANDGSQFVGRDVQSLPGTKRVRASVSEARSDTTDSTSDDVNSTVVTSGVSGINGAGIPILPRRNRLAHRSSKRMRQDPMVGDRAPEYYRSSNKRVVMAPPEASFYAGTHSTEAEQEETVVGSDAFATSTDFRLVERKITSPERVVSVSPRNAFLEKFQERLIDAFSPTTGIECGYIRGLRAAAEMRVFSPPLYYAFQATALTFIGREESNPSIEAEGHRLYHSILASLQEALNHPQQSRSMEVLVIVVLLIMLEAFKRTSADAVYKHQVGGLRLLEFRGPYSHRSGIEHSFFVDLRLYWVCAALVTRAPTFLATHEWKTIPWSATSTPKDILHLLLDEVVEIPAFLSHSDQFEAAIRTGGMSATEAVSVQSMLRTWSTELNLRLQQWEETKADRYEKGKPWEVETPTDDGLPVFRCRNMKTMDLMTPTSLLYPDLLLATSMCTYWAVRLVLTTVKTSPADSLSPTERYQYACNICRSMRFYIKTVPGHLISRMMFSLRVAYDTFTEGTLERAYVREVFLYIGAKFRFPIFSSLCPEVSTTNVEESPKSVVMLKAGLEVPTGIQKMVRKQTTTA